jgi:hypothetical protein
VLFWEEDVEAHALRGRGWSISPIALWGACRLPREGDGSVLRRCRSGRPGDVLVHTVVLMIVRRALGVLGCGPALSADAVEIAVLRHQLACCAAKYRGHDREPGGHAGPGFAQNRTSDELNRVFEPHTWRSRHRTADAVTGVGVLAGVQR